MTRRRCLPALLPLLMPALLAAALPAPAAAEEGCAAALREAQADYAAGAFAEALSALGPCLDQAGKPTREERDLATELKAKVEVATDEMEAARRTIADLLRSYPVYQPNPVNDPPRYVRLVAQVRRGASTVLVSSVSKTSESLREAPATVQVLTAEEIRRRGYLDLEALLHDLSGFDISRTNGLSYSNVYQRGYRSSDTNRTLLLVDGIEENDLWARIAYLSRQYPLSNVERVEVIHGPASTMYGANAFAGVINVITRDPEALITGDRRFGARVEASAGSFATRTADLSVAGRTADGDLSWSLTGRVFRSEEPDLSRFSDWDFASPFPLNTAADYTRVGSLNLSDPTRVALLLLQQPGLAGSPYFTVRRDASGRPLGLALTAAGVARARALDSAALAAREVGGAPIGFSDPTRDSLLAGKLKLSNLVLGFETWRQHEGMTPWFTDRSAVGADNGQIWAPQQSWLYAKYSRPLSRDLTFSFFSHYKLHELDKSTLVYVPQSYAAGTLGAADLLNGRTAGWAPIHFFYSNSEVRNELSFAYRRSDRFSLVSGLEVRSSSIQGDYVRSSTPLPAETGVVGSPIPGGNQFNARDAGLYLQASYRPWTRLKLVAGGRVDHDRVRQSLGYGTVFNPRLAAVWTQGPWVGKAIYAEAFHDPANFQKYATVPGVRELANPDLAPEKARNLELAASWQRSPRLAVEIAAYEARYSDIAQTALVTCRPEDGCSGPTTRQNRNLGAQRVRGVQLDARGQLGRCGLFGNYTYASPYATDPRDANGQPLAVDRLRVGDIASHSFNLGADAALGRWQLDLRLNHVGARPTGAGTTVSLNPLRGIDPYTVVNATLTRAAVLPGVDLQLVVENLLDESYENPGVRDANGIFNAAAIPQPGRAVYLRSLYSF